jgi:hypothetical protein
MSLPRAPYAAGRADGLSEKDRKEKWICAAVCLLFSED